MEVFMRGVIVPLVALAGCVAMAVPAQTAPAVPHHDLSISAITPVRQRCGQGMKRTNASQDKQGAWHGPCVPKHATGPSAARAAGSSDNVANQLNAQEAARTAGGGMVAPTASPTLGIPGAGRSPNLAPAENVALGHSGALNATMPPSTAGDAFSEQWSNLRHLSPVHRDQLNYG